MVDLGQKADQSAVVVDHRQRGEAMRREQGRRVGTPVAAVTVTTVLVMLSRASIVPLLFWRRYDRR